MKRFRVIVPPVVEEQILAQVFYIARDSIENALAWEERLRAALKKMGGMPRAYPLDAAASERLGIAVRKMAFEGTYLIFYYVNEPARAVEIINFRHGVRLPRPDEA